MRVKSERGEVGFLSAESAERDADRDARARRAARIFTFAPVFGVVAEDAVVRLAPFALAPRAGILTRGSAVSIYAVDHDYDALRLPDGRAWFRRFRIRRPRAAGSQETRDRGGGLLSTQGPDRQGSRSESPDSESRLRGRGGAPRSRRRPPMRRSSPRRFSRRSTAVYPEAARKAGVEGTVVLDALISEKGRVERRSGAPGPADGAFRIRDRGRPPLAVSACARRGGAGRLAQDRPDRFHARAGTLMAIRTSLSARATREDEPRLGSAGSVRRARPKVL